MCAGDSCLNACGVVNYDDVVCNRHTPNVELGSTTWNIAANGGMTIVTKIYPTESWVEWEDILTIQRPRTTGTLQTWRVLLTIHTFRIFSNNWGMCSVSYPSMQRDKWSTLIARYNKAHNTMSVNIDPPAPDGTTFTTFNCGAPQPVVHYIGRAPTPYLQNFGNRRWNFGTNGGLTIITKIHTDDSIQGYGWQHLFRIGECWDVWDSDTCPFSIRQHDSLHDPNIQLHMHGVTCINQRYKEGHIGSSTHALGVTSDSDNLSVLVIRWRDSDKTLTVSVNGNQRIQSCPDLNMTDFDSDMNWIGVGDNYDNGRNTMGSDFVVEDFHAFDVYLQDDIVDDIINQNFSYTFFDVGDFTATETSIGADARDPTTDNFNGQIAGLYAYDRFLDDVQVQKVVSGITIDGTDQFDRQLCWSPFRQCEGRLDTCGMCAGDSCLNACGVLNYDDALFDRTHYIDLGPTNWRIGEHYGMTIITKVFPTDMPLPTSGGNVEETILKIHRNPGHVSTDDPLPWRLDLGTSKLRMWQQCNTSDCARVAENEGLGQDVICEIDFNVVRNAWNSIVARHNALDNTWRVDVYKPTEEVPTITTSDCDDMGYAWISGNMYASYTRVGGQSGYGRYLHGQIAGLYGYDRYLDDSQVATVLSGIKVGQPDHFDRQLCAAVCNETDGWVSVGNRCVKAYTSPKLDWNSAKLACFAEVAQLVVPQNDFDHAQLTTLFGFGKWVGVHDQDVEGTWVTSAGTEVTYTNWCATGSLFAEPNNGNFPYGNAEHCARMEGSDYNGCWNDISCEPNLGYICEKPGM
jgi:hypothetical protein